MDSSQLVEYYIQDRILKAEVKACSCVIAEGRCSSVECTKDDDCKDASGNWRYDPVNHTKIVCDCPSGSCSLKKDNDYTCKPLPSCKTTRDDCAPGWCCTADPILPAECKDFIGSCVSQGNMRCNNKYLCDPPEWNSGEASKKKSLLELILSFNPFS
ncbi:MAG: hypothetical protein JTT17_07355 [Candidatus Brockarchaeota archaeon]|nr:hypothetical protein [Candidatus Brockarchaeota archaeon]